mmetsp:Transcript_40226/g.64440  ORF Transcript_40226/g.64440 Transcript_40226/m.64440 type:complete len:202 (-) Transcript_40226:187-792(-)
MTLAIKVKLQHREFGIVEHIDIFADKSNTTHFSVKPRAANLLRLGHLIDGMHHKRASSLWLKHDNKLRQFALTDHGHPSSLRMNRHTASSKRLQIHHLSLQRMRALHRHQSMMQTDLRIPFVLRGRRNARISIRCSKHSHQTHIHQDLGAAKRRILCVVLACAHMRDTRVVIMAIFLAVFVFVPITVLFASPSTRVAHFAC